MLKKKEKEKGKKGTQRPEPTVQVLLLRDALILSISSENGTCPSLNSTFLLAADLRMLKCSLAENAFHPPTTHMMERYSLQRSEGYA